MNFEWDENKHRQNIEKHGLTFHLAEMLFNENLISSEDVRKNYGEARYTGFGMIEGRCINVVYTHRKDTIRLISMRKANERETRAYKEKLAKLR